MLAKLIPPTVVILKTRQRGQHNTLRRTHEFRSRLRTRVLRIFSRVEFSYERLYQHTNFSMPLFE
jgi:hypothetical protein